MNTIEIFGRECNILIKKLEQDFIEYKKKKGLSTTSPTEPTTTNTTTKNPDEVVFKIQKISK